MIQQKNDQITHNSSQEQSGTVLQVQQGSWCTSNDTRELKIGIKPKINILCCHDVKWDIRIGPILWNSSQEPPMSSKYNCVLGTLIFMLQLKIDMQLKNCILKKLRPKFEGLKFPPR